jgi:DNA-binding CsgD family transcriptional regulator
VKTLIHQICIKLEAHNRNEAIFFAVRRGEIRPNELYTLDELAELFSAFHPDMLRRVTHLVREDLEHGHLSGKDEQIIRTDRRKDTILTKCERDVLILVGRGLTNREIADTLYISINAVSTFLYRACTKLGTHKRVGALVLALKRGEISMGEIYSLNELVRALATLEAESIEKIAQLLTQKLGQEPVPAGS